MKVLAKLFLVLFVMNITLTSCTTEDLNTDGTTNVSSDEGNHDVNPPVEEP